MARTGHKATNGRVPWSRCCKQCKETTWKLSFEYVNTCSNPKCVHKKRAVYSAQIGLQSGYNFFYSELYFRTKGLCLYFYMSTYFLRYDVFEMTKWNLKIDKHGAYHWNYFLGPSWLWERCGMAAAGLLSLPSQCVRYTSGRFNIFVQISLERIPVRLSDASQVR